MRNANIAAAVRSEKSFDLSDNPHSPSKLNVLLVGDASNCHNALANGLRKLGQNAVVASDGTEWMNTERQIDLRRRWNNKIGGAELWLRTKTLLPRMAGFDVVSIATQGFIRLRPERQRYIYDYLRANNRKVIYTALGTDSNYVEWAIRDDCPLRYTEYSYHGIPTPFATHEREKMLEWLSPAMTRFCDHIFNTIDGAVSVLYEYDLALRHRLPPEKIAYIGIPIDIDSLNYNELTSPPQKLRLLLGRHSRRILEKGGEIMEAAAKAIVKQFPDRAELVIVENRPYREYLERLKSAHLLLDQLYSYTPATSALLAMAHGICTVSGAEPEYYDFIGERDSHPIINGLPDYEPLVQQLITLVKNPTEIISRGNSGREFVERHNSDRLVAQRFINFCHKILNTPAVHKNPLLNCNPD